MAIVTATQVAAFTNISASAGTIISSGLIPIVQERINLITNNYFTTDMFFQSSFTIGATDGTITGQNSFSDEGFAVADEVYIYNSYRNDGYKTVSAVSGVTLAMTSSLLAEPSARSILISVVQWPAAIAYTAAQMVKYDYDDRSKQTSGVKSHTLGPFSETFGGASVNGRTSTPFGYPQDLIDGLSPYTIVRLN